MMSSASPIPRNITVEALVASLRRKASDFKHSDVTTLFVDIPPECFVDIEALLELLPSDSAIIDKFNVCLKHYDLTRLRPEGWLNDEIINFFLKLCEEKDRKISNQVSTWKSNAFMNSYFYYKLVESDGGFNFSNVASWTKNVNVFSCNHVFIPINFKNLHWALVVISMTSREIKYLDSVSKDGMEIMVNLNRWLVYESMAKRKTGLSPFKLRNISCPQQDNSYDCGVFVLSFIDLISNNLPIAIMSQPMCDVIRKRLAYWIIKGDLVNYYSCFLEYVSIHDNQDFSVDQSCMEVTWSHSVADGILPSSRQVL